jgi:GTP cyclohydrolase-4
MDVQERKPSVKEEIGRVGVEGVKVFLRTKKGKEEISYFPTVDLFINLPKEKRGIHMSRLTETITDVILSKATEVGGKLEEFGRRVLEDLALKHPYQKGQIAIRSTLLLRKRTPITRSKSVEPYDVCVTVNKNGPYFDKVLTVEAIGSTACPHSLEASQGRAHIQRSRLKVEFKTDMDTSILLEELIDACEKAFSSPTYTVLKTEDEQYVVDRMYGNPKFIEDVVRDCFKNVRKLGYKGRVKVMGISEESIHKHNVVAEIEKTL